MRTRRNTREVRLEAPSVALGRAIIVQCRAGEQRDAPDERGASDARSQLIPEFDAFLRRRE